MDVMMEKGQFPTSTPEEQGILSSGILEFLDEIDRLQIDLHSLYIFRNGKMVVGQTRKPFKPDSPHRIYSAAKSFTCLAVLFAIQEGKLHLDDQVIKYFPDDLPEVVSENLKALKVYNLLTMSTGQLKDPFEKMRIGEHQAKDFFATDFELKPGTYFNYNNGVPHILGLLVHKVTGQNYVDYLKPRLTDPLGLYVLVSPDKEGEMEGSTTVVTPESLAKLSLFYLQEGSWNGVQLLDKELVRKAVSFQIPTESPVEKHTEDEAKYGYGFQMWRNAFGGFRLSGGRCQKGICIPEENLCIVWNAWEIGKGLENQLADVCIFRHMYKNPIEVTDEIRENQKKLAKRLASWSCAPLGTTDTKSEVRNGVYELEANNWNLKEISFNFDGPLPQITLTSDKKSVTLNCGLNGDFASNGPDFVEMPPRDVLLRKIYGVEQDDVLVSGGYDENKFIFQIRHTNWMGFDTFAAEFEGDKLRLFIENIDEKLFRLRSSEVAYLKESYTTSYNFDAAGQAVNGKEKK